jgi:hypothetical protein
MMRDLGVDWARGIGFVDPTPAGAAPNAAPEQRPAGPMTRPERHRFARGLRVLSAVSRRLTSRSSSRRCRDLDRGARRGGVAVRGVGLGPTVVAVRWMNVVAPSRSPSGPVVVETADNSSQGIAVASTVTPSTRWATTVLPSLARQVGLAKWVAMSLPISPYRSRAVPTSP